MELGGLDGDPLFGWNPKKTIRRQWASSEAAIKTLHTLLKSYDIIQDVASVHASPEKLILKSFERSQKMNVSATPLTAKVVN